MGNGLLGDAVEEISREFGLNFVFGRLHYGEIPSRWRGDCVLAEILKLILERPIEKHALQCEI